MSVAPLPADIQPGQRRTRLMIEIENQQIIGLMQTGFSDYYIQQKLKIKPKNYKKRILKLRRQDLDELIDKQTAEAKAQLLATCIRKIQALEIHAQDLLINERDIKPLEKLATMDRIRQYAIDIGRLNTEGPFVFSILSNGLYRRDDTTRIPGDTAELSEPTPEIADPNRVA